MHRVFVYGSLKRGLENHHLLGTAEFAGKAVTAAPFRMMDGPYPVLREGDDRGRKVSGELYKVDDRTLEVLDDLEGVAERLYDRVEIDVVMTEGSRPLRAFVYIGCAEHWDRKPRSSFLTRNSDGHLEWTPPQSR
ncbi:MAG TPA: gamma-glutamylcyclotransferase family protein [Afipia sp.]